MTPPSNAELAPTWRRITAQVAAANGPARGSSPPSRLETGRPHHAASISNKAVVILDLDGSADAAAEMAKLLGRLECRTHISPDASSTLRALSNGPWNALILLARTRIHWVRTVMQRLRALHGPICCIIVVKQAEESKASVALAGTVAHVVPDGTGLMTAVGNLLRELPPAEPAANELMRAKDALDSLDALARLLARRPYEAGVQSVVECALKSSGGAMNIMQQLGDTRELAALLKFIS